MGYSSNHKGYKCFDPYTNRTYISRHVIFNETSFPFSKTHSIVPTDLTALSLTDVPARPPVLHTSLLTPIQQETHLTIDSSPHNTSSDPCNSPSIAHTPVLNTTDSTNTNKLSSTSLTNSHSSSSLAQQQDCSSSPGSTQRSKTIINQHHMITRAKSSIFKPKLYLTYTEPKSVAQAVQDTNWRQAMLKEFQALQQNNTWTIVPLPPNRCAIGCKWLFKVKENPDGSIQRYKARLVAKGFNQEAGLDFTETCSPVVKLVTIRVILTLALAYNWPINQLDVRNVFLNGNLKEDIYMQQPPGFEQADKTFVCKLNKALYGLKQAPRA